MYLYSGVDCIWTGSIPFSPCFYLLLNFVLRVMVLGGLSDCNSHGE